MLKLPNEAKLSFCGGVFETIFYHSRHRHQMLSWFSVVRDVFPQLIDVPHRAKLVQCFDWTRASRLPLMVNATGEEVRSPRL